ncbi:hypothetical protein [Mycobacterium sp. MMS18-G62]
MTVTDLDELESLLDDIDSDESDEAYRRPLRTPTRRGSFQARTGPSPASQGQVQATARSLDAKIETLSNAVKALESRTNGIASSQTKTTAALRKETIDRRKGLDGTRADLQQTKMLSVLLPMLTQETVTVKDGDKELDVLTASKNQFATMLPLLFLMTPSSGGDAAKSPLGDPMMLILLLIAMKPKTS